MIEFTELKHMFEIKYTDGLKMMLCSCTPEILPDVLKMLMDDGNRIEQVNSKWM